MFEDEEYVAEAPFVPSSDFSRPKRARVHEPLEGSSEGPTDPTMDDDSSRGAMNGKSASTPTDPAPGESDDSRRADGGGPDGIPLVEAGWLVE